jgi:branched-chain amino acid transport system ATP-binding protein
VIETGNATTSPNTGPALLSVQGLKVAYVRVEALSGLDLTVHAGEILTGIGSNGAGKRTFLNARFGSLPLKDGRILLEGAPAQAVGVEQQAERGLALVPEARAPFAVRQHDGDRHSAAGRSPIPLGKPGHAPAHTGRGAGDVSAAGRPGLPAGLYAFGRRAAGGERRVTGGGRQMLALGRALMGQPGLLRLDTPSLGLAPLIGRDLFRLISGLRDQGMSVLLMQQNARAALRVADHANALALGQVCWPGRRSSCKTTHRCWPAIRVRATGCRQRWGLGRPEPQNYRLPLRVPCPLCHAISTVSRFDPSGADFDKEEIPIDWLARVYGVYTLKMEKVLKPIGLDIPVWRTLLVVKGQGACSRSRCTPSPSCRPSSRRCTA